MNQDSETFRGLMLYIANELTLADRVDLAYYFKIPAGKRKALCEIPSGLFEELERRGHIGPGNLEFLQKSLKKIWRQDLACEVENFDSSRKSRLRSKSVNYVESSGYRLGIDGGEHLVNDEGDDYVHLQSGQSYELVLNNFNSHRCKCKVKIDGRVIFPGLVIEAGDEFTLDRPSNTDGQFKFFAVRDAPPDSGIDQRNIEENGCIQVTFTPEVAKMKITCYTGESEVRLATCSLTMTDIEFHQSISSLFSCDAATVLINGWKPLNKLNKKLVDYGIKDGSRVIIKFGLVGGGTAPNDAKAERSENNSSAPIEWIPGATTMQGQSEQTFEDVLDFVPNSETREVALHLRLVARADETPIRSNGKCTPFILGNRHAPPV
ncbi:hypothetical protein BRAFLDRAFT_117890 [Paramuricea clavata]|uniref:Uncharacterized protein n=1 Tax=Paramuricea clavata TaxID=317549 RepID=A0A7D9I1B5_PARCT|nr:hypothetical protein BRAFLDRAFT_117890 [Paramuricea clavata]